MVCDVRCTIYGIHVTIVRTMNHYTHLFSHNLYSPGKQTYIISHASKTQRNTMPVPVPVRFHVIYTQVQISNEINNVITIKHHYSNEKFFLKFCGCFSRSSRRLYQFSCFVYRVFYRLHCPMKNLHSNGQQKKERACLSWWTLLWVQ